MDNQKRFYFKKITKIDIFFRYDESSQMSDFLYRCIPNTKSIILWCIVECLLTCMYTSIRNEYIQNPMKMNAYLLQRHWLNLHMCAVFAAYSMCILFSLCIPYGMIWLNILCGRIISAWNYHTGMLILLLYQKYLYSGREM